MFNNERAAHALCAGMRVTGCNSELMSFEKIHGLSMCVCLYEHSFYIVTTIF